MFKIHRCEQRSQEWDDLRAGRITASIAKKLVTPTGKASSTYRGEIGRIVAEAMGWQPPEFFQKSYWMERGIDLEPEARGMDEDIGVRQPRFEALVVEQRTHRVYRRIRGYIFHQLFDLLFYDSQDCQPRYFTL